LNKSYQPGAIEARHYSRWEAANYFAAGGAGEAFCIVIPPPNVTGTLHMGHAFQMTIMDALTRYHRMAGFNTLWQPGTDHAGIATQMVVERLLNQEGTDRRTLGREKFLERVWQWKERSGNTITNQMRRLAASVDWTRERFTMDDGLSAAVTEVFVRLYDEGLIYRGKRLVNWDPVLHTALSDLEVLASEERGKLWRFRYPLSDGSGHVVVATTRPETMLGDTAVAVHPDDARYARFVGRTVDLPLTGRRIPVIADEYVDAEFGTGCVKITPAHDFNDYEIGRRHDLEMINVLDDNAALNETAPEAYRGLDRFDAREKIIADLDALGLLDGIDEHTSMIPRGDRSGSIVEPYLTDQWYVRAEPLAQPAIAAVEDGRIRFVPKNWENEYFHWMRNIQDWCISRQLWWGHRIPAWYDEHGKIFVGRSLEDVKERNGLPDTATLRQDEDVLDTWFSSELWPFTTMGWPAKTDELETYYPTSVLVTGFDIIFFWVARMIMMGLKFMNDVPFRDVYIHGLIRDSEGNKMSKAKGNILDPLDIIDGVDLDSLLKKRSEGMMQTHLKERVIEATKKEFPDGIESFGTDALRFTFAAIATNARDLRFDLARVEGYHRFCNKLWNATRFVLANHSRETEDPADVPANEWIRSRLHRTIAAVDAGYAGYRLDLVAQALYDFAWHELCDWYLELSKITLNDPDGSAALKQGTRDTLAAVLGATLRLLHPLMPFITEELWLNLCEETGRRSESIVIERLPTVGEYSVNEEIETEFAWMQAIVTAIRQIRGEMNVRPSVKVAVRLGHASSVDLERLGRQEANIRFLANISEITPFGPDEEATGAATALVGEMQVLVLLAGAIDLDAERDRLSKQLQKARKDLESTSRKLQNERFVANAPADIVAKERARQGEFEQKIRQFEEQLTKLNELE